MNRIMLKKIGIIVLVIGVLIGAFSIYQKLTKKDRIEIPVQDETPPTLEVVVEIDSSDYWREFALEQKEVFEFQLGDLKELNKTSQKTISWFQKNRRVNNDDIMDNDLYNEILLSIDSLEKLGF